jgi:hypothetical protein
MRWKGHVESMENINSLMFQSDSLKGRETKKQRVRVWTRLNCTVQWPVAVLCEDINEPPGSMNGKNSLTSLVTVSFQKYFDPQE